MGIKEYASGITGGPLKESNVEHETKEHIGNVARLLGDVIKNLKLRGANHDSSKLEDPEFATFVEYTEKLKGSTYGSDEYKQFLKDMKPALDHHYESNSHHPEHYDDGVDGMDLLDLVEMICDWKAATMRHDDGDIRKSLEINKERFNLSPQLYNILKNTINNFKF
jgi:hypothetical protein